MFNYLSCGASIVIMRLLSIQRIVSPVLSEKLLQLCGERIGVFYWKKLEYFVGEIDTIETTGVYHMALKYSRWIQLSKEERKKILFSNKPILLQVSIIAGLLCASGAVTFVLIQVIDKILLASVFPEYEGDTDVFAIIVLFVFYIGIAIYFLPTLVAGLRRIKGTGYIVFANSILGWTGLGWIVLIISAINAKKNEDSSDNKDTREFPRMLFLTGVINIIPVLFLIFLTVFLIPDTLNCFQERDHYNLSIYFYMTTMMNVIVIGILTVILLIRKSAQAFSFMLIHLCALLLFMVWTFCIIDKDWVMTHVLMMFVPPFAVFAWNASQLFRPSSLMWLRNNSGSIRKIFSLKSVLIFCVLVMLQVGGVTAVNKIGIEKHIVVSNAMSASSRSDQNLFLQLQNDETEKYWTPSAGSGVDEWIKLDLNSQIVVSGLAISSGSESSAEFNRPKRIMVETSDGTRVVQELANVGTLQRIPLGNRKIEWVKITFKSVYQGTKNEPMRISAIKVFVKEYDTIPLVRK